MVAYAFNASAFQPQYGMGNPGFPVNPDGSNAKYKVVICDTNDVPTKDKLGQRLILTLLCIEGPHANQKMDDGLNMHNTSQRAVQIANEQLSAYCHVTGKFVINDTQELCNIPFWIEVGYQKDSREFTEVKHLFDINGNEPGKAGAGPVVAAQPQPVAPPAAGVAPQAAPPTAWAPPTTPQAPPTAPTAWAPPGQAAPPAAAPGAPAAWSPPGGGAAPAPPAWGGGQR